VENIILQQFCGLRSCIDSRRKSGGVDLISPCAFYLLAVFLPIDERQVRITSVPVAGSSQDGTFCGDHYYRQFFYSFSGSDAAF
jgi:hypothetical protein